MLLYRIRKIIFKFDIIVCCLWNIVDIKKYNNIVFIVIEVVCVDV